MVVLRVAIFDFDGTLYKEETFQLMMNHMKNHPIYHKNYKRFYLSILPIYISYKLKLYPEDRMKERLMHLYVSSFGNISKQDLMSYFNEAALKMEKNFNDEVVARLKEHKQEGTYTMLVSGAYTMLLNSIPTKDLFDKVIGTELPVQGEMIDRHQRLYHIQGERKNESILKALEGKNINWENSFAYGDSYSDLPVLEMVGNPVAVQPDKKLLPIATERNWEII